MTTLIDTKELSKALGLKEGDIRKMVMRRQIPYVKLTNRRVRFDVVEIEKFIKDRTVTAKSIGQ